MNAIKSTIQQSQKGGDKIQGVKAQIGQREQCWNGMTKTIKITLEEMQNLEKHF